MAKITQINIGDTGEASKNKINEAMKTVETDATLNGTGETESPLGVSAAVVLEAPQDGKTYGRKDADWVETGGNEFDSIQFNIDPPVITDIGTVLWNKNEYTINVNTGLGATIQVGLETLILYFNDTGAVIDNFSVMHLKGAVDVSGYLVKAFEPADASDHDKCQGTLAVATHECGIGELGFLTRFGDASNGDTSGVAAGAQLWISASTPGKFTDVKPVFPNYAISIGGSYNSDAVNGKIFINITGSVEDVFNQSWSGAIKESLDFLVTSNGTVVTGTLTNVNPLLNLTCIFSDVGLFTFDTTTAPSTIELTAGTDSTPQNNYIYIPIETKVLTKNLTGWPTTEHCKVAILTVQSAATVQSEGGAERNQNINDHIKTEDDNGHILHIAERIRRLNADHDSGTEATLTGTPINGYIQVTGGFVWQLHKQIFQSFTMPTRNVIIRNDFTTPNRRTDNLNTITAYSTGSSWSNEWSKIVVWGVANKTGEIDFVKINLPSDGYNSEASAIADASNFADYTIPSEFKGVGFLIAAFTFRISGGAVTYNGGTAYQDLRGFVPNNIAGGGGGSGVTSLLGLEDTPSSYAGAEGYLLGVNSAESAVEFINSIVGSINFEDGLTSDANALISGQAVGGDNIVAFSATPIFNFDTGNAQQITITADITSWSIINEEPAGSYVIYFIQDGTGGWAIPDPTGIDKQSDNSMPDFITSAGDINIVNIIVLPDGTSIWSLVDQITA